MRFGHWAFVPVLAVLAACGGGGGSDSSGPPVPAAVLKISGTAVRGAALAGVTVQVKCGAGTGSATTGADGSFTVSITQGSLPCVLQAPLPDGGFLHSAIGGSGTGEVSANISPLTELVVASAAGVDPQTLFDDFAVRQAAVTPSALTSAVAKVVTQLSGVIDLSGANPLTDAIVIGQGLDVKIDTLNAALAEAGSTLQDLTQAAVAASPAQPAPTSTDYDAGTSGAASVASELVLKPAASNCAALRSGDYRVVFFLPGADTTRKVSINVDTFVVTNEDGSTDQLTPNGSCRYRTADGGEVVVSGAGVLMIRGPDAAGAFRTGIAFAEQAHTLAEVQGAWNWIGQESLAAGGVRAFAGDLVYDAAGTVTAANRCNDLKTCADDTANINFSLVPNAAGGWNIVNGANEPIGRMFQFKAGGGSSMLVGKFDVGTYAYLTRPRSTAVATVGNVGRSWNPGTSSQLLSTGGVTESGNTIATADAATQTYTRNNIVGTVGATVLETLRVNQPRNGYTTRDANPTAVATDGSAINVREFVFLSLRGMGLTPVAFGFNNSLTVSVALPGNTFVAAELINRAGATSCAALRSGRYRQVTAQPSTQGTEPTLLVDFDAATLSATAVGSTGAPTALLPNGNCRFSTADGSDITVTQAGVIVMRVGTTDRLRIAFPEQSHTVAELQGTWNKLGLQSPETSPGAFFADAATVTLDAAGTATTAQYCVDVTTCQPVSVQIAHTVNPNGGFDRVTQAGETPDRVFAFRAGNGDLMLVSTDASGAVGFWTQQRVNALPAVGTRNNNWDFVLDPTTLVPTLSTSSNSILSVDNATQTVVRARRTAANASYTETVVLNNPRNGYNHRPGGTTTASDGSTVTIREFTSLNLRGMGFSPLKYQNGATPTVLLSVSRP